MSAPTSSPPTNQAFKYPECKKGQFHTGESLSLVCIEPKCIENSVICGICYNEAHRDHKIKPLKIIINNSRKYLEQLTPINIDGGEIKEFILGQKKAILTKYDEFQKYVVDSITTIKENINAVFVKITEKIDLKTGSKDELLQTLDEIKEQQLQNEKFIALMKKLLAGVPLEPESQQSESSSKQVKDTITSIIKRIQKKLETQTETVKKQITGFSTMLQGLSNNLALFDSKVEFKFSNEMKHTGCQVVSDTVIKSVEAYNYHFGLLEPGLNEKGSKPIQVEFLIRECSSNWVAVGLCHKTTVQTNSYQFNYSLLGHGGYLISSNGGSWSSIDSTKNNVVNSFNYGKNDTVIVHYIPQEKKIVFTKKGTEQTHTLEVDQTKEDDLYLCCLFYYNSDEIEYLGYSSAIGE